MKRRLRVTDVLQVTALLGVFSLLAAGCTAEQTSEEEELGSLSEGAVDYCTAAPPHVRMQSPECPIGFERVTSPSGSYNSSLCPKRFIVEFTGANGQTIFVTPKLAEPMPRTRTECESLSVEMDVYQNIDPPGTPTAYWYKHPRVYYGWGVWQNGCTVQFNYSGIFANDGNPYLGKYRLVGRAMINGVNRAMSYSVYNHDCD